MIRKAKAKSKKNVTMLLSQLAAKEMGRMINVPCDQWAGRCYEISARILDAGICEGKLCYGLYYGKVHRNSFFGRRGYCGAIRHGWISLDDGVMDPTRFAFENKPPYIYFGPVSGEYDFAASNLGSRIRGPFPPATQETTAVPVDLVSAVTDAVRLGSTQLHIYGQITELDRSQIFWIANQQHESFGDKVADVYRWITNIGYGAAIPVDNQIFVFGRNGDNDKQ